MKTIEQKLMSIRKKNASTHTNKLQQQQTNEKDASHHMQKKKKT